MLGKPCLVQAKDITPGSLILLFDQTCLVISSKKTDIDWLQYCQSIYCLAVVNGISTLCRQIYMQGTNIDCMLCLEN
jgi:hypothetical protein